MHALIQRLYWQTIALLLASHFGGWPEGLALAIAVNLVQALHVSAMRRNWRSLDVQVRWFYLGLLLLGTLPALGWLHGLQFAGLIAKLVADYCLAARLLVLLPWNRPVPFSAALLRWVLLSPPGPGSIAERLPHAARSSFGISNPPAHPR